jgi:mRNA interferase RelE/StbE
MTFVNFLKGYKIIFTESAKKDLKALEKFEIDNIDKKLRLLISGQLGLDIKKLSGFNYPTYRLRVGNYRVIYEVLEKMIVVQVIKIKHRKDAYKVER